VGKHSARDGHDGPGDRPPGSGSGTGAPVPPGAFHAPGTGRRRRGDAADDTGGFAVIPPREDGTPQAHPEHREHAAWGTSAGWSGQVLGRPGRSPGLTADPVEEWAEDWAPYDTAAMRPTAAGAIAQTRITPPGERLIPRPRQEFVDVFDAPGAPAPPAPGPPAPVPGGEPGPAPGPEEGRGGGKGRMLGGVAAAVVVTVLAVVVAGQAAGDKHHSGGGAGTGADDPEPSTGDRGPGPGRPTAPPAPAATATYDQQMAARYPLDPELSLSGSFVTVPGHQAAPGRGTVMRFRVDVEKGLPLDARLFSDAVFRTLNDPRSWGHGGTMTFERVSTGPADIVITLASPGTTAKWCAKSGLDTSVENVSCDSASTPRTMINAYRWAQGAATYGPDRMLEYRQMLINHEVGHRLGHSHVGCPKEGALAPVMMQQTKFLSLDGGPTCKPNAWPFP
jgi:hypothetical protein